ncbi:unnamed protein product [Phytophthora lilii]|uniref:Unnamed protein product n=1 Tax=Phytophthora lilii TaxID=2077276 RepID=A0A9W7CSU6_9STRA|nr:unnamed protein product [Phytophthora lilii]
MSKRPVMVVNLENLCLPERQSVEDSVGVPLAQQSGISCAQHPEPSETHQPGGTLMVKVQDKRSVIALGPNADYMLAVQVNVDEPFRAKHSKVSKKWESLCYAEQEQKV